jgi:hypothetical protein
MGLSASTALSIRMLRAKLPHGIHQIERLARTTAAACSRPRVLRFLLANYPVHQKIYVPAWAALGQELPSHEIGVEPHVFARLLKRELPAGAAKHPAVRRNLAAQVFPLPARRRLHAEPPETPVSAAQFDEVVVSPDKNLAAKPPPSGLAVLSDVLVVVVLYDESNHYFVGASQ